MGATAMTAITCFSEQNGGPQMPYGRSGYCLLAFGKHTMAITPMCFVGEVNWKNLFEEFQLRFRAASGGMRSKHGNELTHIILSCVISILASTLDQFTRRTS